MKARRVWMGLMLCVVGVVGAGSLSLWRAKRQYALNRQLIAAIVNHDQKTALALVNAGADPNTRFNPPPSPTFKLLLNQLLRHSPIPTDGSPSAFFMACGAKWYSADTTLHIHQSYPITSNRIRYSYPEDAPLVRAMLAHGADGRAKDALNRSVLHYAATWQYPVVAQLLLEHGANVNAQDDGGMTPLMEAAMNGDTNTMRLLLDHGANVSLVDGSGFCVLREVVLLNKGVECARLLLEHGADPNQKDMDGETPLTLARDLNRSDLVRLLRGTR